MLLLDTNVLSDYLAGYEPARELLIEYEDDEWIVSSLVLYETYMGVLYGYVPGTPDEVLSIVDSTMEIVDVTEQTANESARLQRELLEIGVPADQPDGLIAASAREHGAALVTADETFWNDEVDAVFDVVRYHRE